MCNCGKDIACTSTGECCHSECLGGCSKPGDSGACVACRNFFFKEQCLPSCPAKTYEYEGWRCITSEYCASLRKVSENPRESSKFVIYENRCLSECPPGYTKNESRLVYNLDKKKTLLCLITHLVGFFIFLVFLYIPFVGLVVRDFGMACLVVFRDHDRMQRLDNGTG